MDNDQFRQLIDAIYYVAYSVRAGAVGIVIVVGIGLMLSLGRR